MKTALLVGAVYLCVINLVAFVLCGWDKRKAQKGNWRTKEKTLLLSCALGGSPAFLLGMKLFHHKTQKPLFKFGVPAILILQLALVAFLIYYFFYPAL